MSENRTPPSPATGDITETGNPPRLQPVPGFVDRMTDPYDTNQEPTPWWEPMLAATPDTTSRDRSDTAATGDHLDQT